MLWLSSSIVPVVGNAIEVEVLKRSHKLHSFTMLVTFLLILSIPQASPLVKFFHFHETFLVHSDYDACKEYLIAFKLSYNKVCEREVS